MLESGKTAEILRNITEDREDLNLADDPAHGLNNIDWRLRRLKIACDERELLLRTLFELDAELGSVRGLLGESERIIRAMLHGNNFVYSARQAGSWLLRIESMRLGEKHD